MAEIPTMECPECMGSGRVDDLPDAYYPCPECRESGRIPRPPLTLDEIAALPDGARVVVEWWSGASASYTLRWKHGEPMVRDCLDWISLRQQRTYGVSRVWLAEEE